MDGKSLWTRFLEACARTGNKAGEVFMKDVGFASHTDKAGFDTYVCSPAGMPPGYEMYQDADGDTAYAMNWTSGGIPVELLANRYAMAGDTPLTYSQMVNSPLLTRNFPVTVAADGSVTAADLVAAVATDQHVLYDAALFVENVADNNDGGFARLRDGTTAILANVGIQQAFRGARNFGTNKPIEIQAPAANFVAVAANHQIVITYRTITP